MGTRPGMDNSGLIIGSAVSRRDSKEWYLSRRDSKVYLGGIEGMAEMDSTAIRAV